MLAWTALHGLAQSTYEPYTFTTLAGLAGGQGSADGTGSTARFYFPSGAAVDNAGNVYVADPWNNTIRKVTPAGVVTTLAGLAQFDSSGFNPVGGSADGTGSAARFVQPSGVAVDSAGNLYVADTFNNIIRKGLPAVGPPVFLTQPQSQMVERVPDVRVTFSVLVNGAAPMAYQWRKDGADIAGATNSTFTLLNLQASDAGVFSVVATNGLGSVTSVNAVLTTFVRPPQITTQPQDQTMTQGYPVTLGSKLRAHQGWRTNGARTGPMLRVLPAPATASPISRAFTLAHTALW